MKWTVPNKFNISCLNPFRTNPRLTMEPTKDRYTLDIFCSQYCDIAIKRYCNKKTYFSQYFFPVWIENVYFCIFEYILKCQNNILTKKCLFIFLLQYFLIPILCAKMSRVNKALGWHEPLKVRKNENLFRICW